eukprot:13673464-Ditylum_brightwellii.AAC.1
MFGTRRGAGITCSVAHSAPSKTTVSSAPSKAAVVQLFGAHSGAEQLDTESLRGAVPNCTTQ